MMQCASDPEWWSSISDQTLSGGSPFPPQRELPLRDYALAVEKSRGSYPEYLASAYLVAGMRDPPPVHERGSLLGLPYWELVDCLALRQRPERPAEPAGARAAPSSPRGIGTGAVRMGGSTLVSLALGTTPATSHYPDLPVSGRRRRRSRRVSQPAQPGTRHPPVQPETRHPPVAATCIDFEGATDKPPNLTTKRRKERGEEDWNKASQKRKIPSGFPSPGTIFVED
nr:uncharacterized protein LOC129428136 [Misgurnus anguillicaudatus]